MGSLVDPSYELIDPTPDVHALFCQFDTRFFDGRLAACEVKWSPRMTTCAGICCYETRSGLCSIRLSTPLLKLRPRKDLIETLLHEMIHAFLFVTVRDRDRDGHGPQFQWHMHRINKEAGTRITIFHSFHAEVAVYKNHHWRCEGACRERRPFFGWVKRASNRAPSKNDLWWAEHEKSCGGKFVKVSEPKEYTEKREKMEKKKVEKEEKKTEGGGEKKRDGGKKKDGGEAADAKQPRIDSVFGAGGVKLGGGTDGSALVKAVVGGAGEGTGQMLGGEGAGRSRLLNLFEDGKSTVVDKAQKSTVTSKENESSDDEIQVVEVKKKERPIMGLRGGNRSPTKHTGSGDAPDALPNDYLADINNYEFDEDGDGNIINYEDWPVSNEIEGGLDAPIINNNQNEPFNHVFDEFAFNNENEEGRNAPMPPLQREQPVRRSEPIKAVYPEDDTNFYNAGVGDWSMGDESKPLTERQQEIARLRNIEKQIQESIEALMETTEQEELMRRFAELDSTQSEINRLERLEVLEQRLLRESEKMESREWSDDVAVNGCVGKSYARRTRRQPRPDTPGKTQEGIAEKSPPAGNDTVRRREEKDESEEKEEVEDEDCVTAEGNPRRWHPGETRARPPEARAPATGDEAEVQESKEEVQMEQVAIVRRRPQTFDIPIEQWICLPLPRAEPVFEVLTTMERARPTVRREWKKEADDWMKTHRPTPLVIVEGVVDERRKTEEKEDEDEEEEEDEGAEKSEETATRRRPAMVDGSDWNEDMEAAAALEEEMDEEELVEEIEEVEDEQSDSACYVEAIDEDEYASEAIDDEEEYDEEDGGWIREEGEEDDENEWMEEAEGNEENEEEERAATLSDDVATTVSVPQENLLEPVQLDGRVVDRTQSGPRSRRASRFEPPGLAEGDGGEQELKLGTIVDSSKSGRKSEDAASLAAQVDDDGSADYEPPLKHQRTG